MAISITVPDIDQDDTIGALAGLDSTAGMVVQTGVDAFTKRSLANASAGITWTNPAGTAGNPTPVLANDLAAVEGLASTGIAVRSNTDTWVQRSIAAGTGLTVTNGNGVAGNPTIAPTGSGWGAYLAASASTVIREKLNANRTYYIATTGSDSNDGLSALTPKATFAAIEALARVLDFNGYTVTVQYAAGTYTVGPVVDGQFVGMTTPSQFQIIGDTTTPANCFIDMASGSSFTAVNSAMLRIRGFKVRSASANVPAMTFYLGAEVEFGNIDWGGSTLGGMKTGSGAVAYAVGNCSITASQPFWLLTEDGFSAIDLGTFTFTFTGTPAFSSATILCGEGAYVGIHTATFSGSATGVRFWQDGEGLISLPAKRGGIPGNAAGVVAIPYAVPPQGRISLVTAVAVPTTDQTAKTTVYYTPNKGNLVAYAVGPAEGSVLGSRQFTELSLALDGDSGHTGYHQADKNFDLFLYTVSDYVVALGTGPAWTNDTTRADAVSYNAGIWTNTSSIVLRHGTSAGNTVTVAAGCAIYLGTFRTNGTNGQTEDSLAKRFVWNAYNRVPRAMKVLESTDSWPYSDATIRQLNGAAANQLDFVRGLDEDAVWANFQVPVAGDAAGSIVISMIGLDSTTALAAGCLPGYGYIPVNNYYITLISSYHGLPGLGRHFLAALERGAGANVQTWRGDGGAATLIQAGITGTVLA